MREKVDKDFPGLNLMPPWLTEDLDNVTNKPVQISSGESPLELNRFFYGVEASDCPLPCTTFSTDTKLANKANDGLGFVLEFQQTVEVSWGEIRIKRTLTSRGFIQLCDCVSWVALYNCMCSKNWKWGTTTFTSKHKKPLSELKIKDTFQTETI